jgi:hypothetical protein
MIWLAPIYYAYIAWLIVSVAKSGTVTRPQNTTIPLEVRRGR